MEGVTKYKCENCGQEHDSWPALSYSSPIPYHFLSDEEKETIAELSSDFCVITYPDQTDRFIRCTLTQKVIDHCEDLEYGLWVSLSEKNFQDYSDNYDNEHHEVGYFGWLNSELPDYTFDESIPTDVYTRSGNNRPEIIPHEDFQHPFVYDYYKGITKAEAERRINHMLKNS